MKKHIKSEEEISIEVAAIHDDIQPALYEYSLNLTQVSAETEKSLNLKNLNITMKIKDQYPELLKHIEEMPVTIPNENHPEITINNLTSYFDSLNSILNKYILEHSCKTNI